MRRLISSVSRRFLMSRVIATENAPAAIGPYSQAIAAQGFLFVSGCIGLDPKTMDFTGPDVSAQTEQSLKNMGAILEAGGSGFDRVVKTTVLLRDMADYATVNEIYARYFTSAKPARAAYAVAGLPKDARVEIECVAITGPAQ